MTLAVIIPCLNEEISIAHTIKSIRQFYPEIDVFVIDNGSTDATSAIASQCGALVLFEPQRGKGYAVRSAFARIPKNYSAYFTVDGDDTYGFENLSTAVELVKNSGYDLVIGRREIDPNQGEDRRKVFKFGHSAGNQLLTFLFRVLFGMPITDTLSGWRVMSPGFVKSFVGGASGFDIEAELNVHGFSIRAAVTEVPVSYKGRAISSSSKLRTYRDGWIILRRNLRLFQSERPLIAFGFLAAPWFLGSASLIIPVLHTYQNFHIVPRFPSLIAAVGLFIVGSNLWLAGIILEKTRLIRVSVLRSNYFDGASPN